MDIVQCSGQWSVVRIEEMEADHQSAEPWSSWKKDVAHKLEAI